MKTKSKALIPTIAAAVLSVVSMPAGAQVPEAKVATLPSTILFGVAYYDEYTPVDRVDEDAQMMKAAGINVVRIAESTWGLLEPQPGVFDFRHVDRMLAAMHRQGIKVIVGTPTYAIPTWLPREHPDVLVVRPDGKAEYGPRQNMDITNPNFRAAAERVIVALIDHVRDHPAVIGYQLDNETKAYGTSGDNVQAAFKAAMKAKWSSLDALNAAWGLNYWSNRINRWEDFPSANAAINASMTNAFQDFQRGLVTDYLAWQSKLVRGHARPNQFVTQNFDLAWRGFSYGINPEVNHWDAARALDVAGIDIYHASQSKLTGNEIAFGGDLARSLRDGQNYLVIETEAQGFPEWTPYPGQLRLQAFSHLASGANMIGYWHWATTQNAFETYWRGLLTQDYKPNPVLDEATTIGADLKRLGTKLVNMKKENRVAMYVSNTAQSAFDQFKMNTDAFKVDIQGKPIGYNEVVRGFYDALYRQNVEVDLISPQSKVSLDRYKLIVVPALYAASDAEIAKLNDYAKRGGHLVYSFKSGFSDENTKVRYVSQPGAIAEAAGVTYQLFATPEQVSLAGDPFQVGEGENRVRWWMEMLKPTTAQVVARYRHSDWPAAPAMTRNRWGKGEVSYIGFMPTDALAEKILGDEVRRAGLDLPTVRWPLTVRSGTLNNGHKVRYLLNYSNQPRTAAVPHGAATELLTGTRLVADTPIALKPWGVVVLEEGPR